jgi:hypothetical protein
MPAVVAAALVIACLAAQTPGTPNRWKEYPAPEQGFSVSLPAPPTVKSRTINSQTGKMVIHMFTCQQGATSFTITCTEYVEGVLRPELADQVFDAVRDGMIKGINGKLVGEHRITLDRFPGKEVDCQGGNGTVGRMRIYMVGNRLYQVIGATQEGARGGTLVSRFMTSFQLLREAGAAR